MATGIGIGVGLPFAGRRSDEPGVYRPASASIVYTGQTPSLIVDRILSPASAGITYAGQAPAVSVVTTISPAAAAVTYAGQTPTVLDGSDAYLTNGYSPALVLDFGQDYYRVGGSDSTHAAALTSERSGLATMVDSDGVLKWGAHNLALNSASPATQGVTVVVGADYTVEITGSGSVALSGAGSGTVTAGSPVEITATTTTLTLTVTGSPTTMWCYRSDLGGMVNNPDRGDSYVPTTSAARYLARRNNYGWNGSTWVNKGLLLETESRTNIVTQSNDLSTWTQGTAGSLTRTAYATTGPDGVSSLDLFEITDTTFETKVIRHAFFTSANGQDYCGSVYAKYDDQQFMQLFIAASGTSWFSAIFDLVNKTVTQTNVGTGGTFTQAGVIEDHNGILRLYVSGQWASGASSTTSMFVGFVSSGTPTLASNGTEAYSGTTGVGSYFGFAQLEAGSTPSSYIPTLGSTVTRSADTLTVASGNVPTIGSVVMKGTITYADEGAAGQQTFWRRYTDANNLISVDLDTDSTDTGEVNANQINGGTGATVAIDTYSPGINVPFAIATRHGASVINAATDGTAGTADTTSSTRPTFTTESLAIGYDFMGNIEKVLVFEDDIADTGIEEATA